MLAAGVAVQLAFSLLLAIAYYQYVSQYRDFAARLEPLVASRRLWFNADWGLRYYLEAIGGEAVLADRPLLPQAALVSSRLGGTAHGADTGAAARVAARRDSYGSDSADGGRRRFAFRQRLGRLRAAALSTTASICSMKSSRKSSALPNPTASYLTMAAPEADKQLLLGFYQLEQNQWRWIGPRAMAVLLAPDAGGAKPGGSDAARDSRAIAVPFELAFHIPEAAPARRVTVQLDGRPLASETYLGPGGYTLRAAAMVVPGRPATVEISVDRAFRVAGDSRELGIIVSGLGFVQKP